MMINFSFISLLLTLFAFNADAARSLSTGKSSFHKLVPTKSVTGMFDPFREKLTCEILISQNMVYNSGQVENLCEQAYRDCIIQGLIKEQIIKTQSKDDLPVGITLKMLKEDLAYSYRLVNFHLRGCQLAVQATYGGTRTLETQSLEEAAGFRN